ncbi:MAG: tetratricopeptide repeat protein [bacterium]
MKPLLTGEAENWKNTPVAMETMLPWNQFGWSPNLALVKEGYKYIEAPNPELYHLEEDSDELVNIYEKNKGRARAMARELQKMLKKYGQDPLAGESKRKMDPKDREQLASLGYVMAGDAGPPDKEAPDAKEMIEFKKEYDKALKLKSEGKPQKAIEKLKEVVKKNPRNNKVTISLAEWLRLEGEPQQARHYLEKVIHRQPNQVEAYIKLALAYVDLGKLDKAEESAKKALELGVKKHKTYRILGIVYLKKKDYKKSLLYSEKAIEIYPAYHQAYAGVALAYQEMGKYDKALDALYTARQLHPRNQKYKMFIKSVKKEKKAEKARQ